MKVFNYNYTDQRRVLFDRRNNTLHQNHETFDLVLFGDSITEGFNFQKYGKVEKSVLNSGIGGDILQLMNERFELDVRPFNPKQVLFMGGINDIYHWFTTTIGTVERPNYLPEEKIINYCIDNISKIIDKCEAFGYEIIVCKIIKINDREKLNCEYVNQVIDTINEKIAEICDKNNIQIVDYNQVLLNELSLLSRDLSDDGLHPNELGYYKMFELLKSKNII